jgi:hypothetical protein
LQDVEVVVRVHVDEARRQSEAGGIDGVCSCVRQGGTDFGDSILFERDIEDSGLFATAVKYQCILDESVAVRHRAD